MRRTLLFRVLVSTVAAVTAATALPAAAAAAGGTPGDQPLPGYTIVNPPLAPATSGGQATTVKQGTHGHAAYIIEVPAHWNGDLVMWAHGYRGQGTVLTVDPPAFGLRQRLLDQGYAWAASSYSGNGFDIRAGVLSTKDLTDHFGRTVRRPHRTYIAGVSMGGYIIGRALEEYPQLYDGALPMCGVLGDQRLIDYFLDFQLTAGALSGVKTYPAGADYLTTVVPAVQQQLGIATISPVAPEPTNALGKQFRDIAVNLTGGPRPGAAASFAYWKNFVFSLSAPSAASDTPAQDPGLISTNLFTRYTPNTPVNVNREVQRVAPEDLYQRLSGKLTQVPKIDGQPRVPVLSLHDLGDMFVPFVNEQQYKADVDRNGRGRLLVQRAVRATEHCEFSPAEAGAAWDDLVGWVRHDRKPAGDRLDARSVAAPDFGCRFSDKAAYATGTRRLFPACP
jgi:pimeloyl-ACP methyl ester carboxylesterase